MKAVIVFALLLAGSNYALADERIGQPGERTQGAVAAHSGPEYGTVNAASCRASVKRKGRLIPLSAFPAKILKGDELMCEGPGKMDVVMSDKTQLTLYKNSRVVMEDYLLRTEGGPGAFAINMLGGAFRFGSTFTGSETERYTIDAHSGTIGVRGTIFTAEIKGTSLIVAVEKGEVRVTSKATKEDRYVRNGQKVEVTPSGFYK